jgi:hypothetical protein
LSSRLPSAATAGACSASASSLRPRASSASAPSDASGGSYRVRPQAALRRPLRHPAAGLADLIVEAKRLAAAYRTRSGATEVNRTVVSGSFRCQVASVSKLELVVHRRLRRMLRALDRAKPRWKAGSRPTVATSPGSFA